MEKPSIKNIVEQETAQKDKEKKEDTPFLQLEC